MLSTKTGAIIVTSGIWVPPLKGSFNITISPILNSTLLIASFTLSGIEPKCTGM